MAKKKKWRTKPFKAIDAYVNARSFWMAVRAIAKYSEEYPDNQKWLFPLIVNEAFCLELHLKCLKRVRRQIPAQNHDVESLFNSLSKMDKKKIIGHLSNTLKEHPETIEPGIAHDAESILARTKAAFHSGRYWHEKLPPSRDSAGIASNAGAVQLIVAVNRRILDIHPEWKDKTERVKFRFGN